jgi:hypothetical protein
MSGTLQINQLQASLPTVNPAEQTYLVAELNGQQQTTSLASGNNPVWNDPITLSAPGSGNVMDLTVYRNGTNDAHNYIGKARVSADPMVMSGNGNDWFDLADATGRQTGKVNVSWTGPTAGLGGQQAVVQQHSNHPGLLTYSDVHDTEPDNFRGPMWSGPEAGYGTMTTNRVVRSGGPGTLTIRPIEGRFNENLDRFSNMDPYLMINIGGQQAKTQVHVEGGKTPRWNDTLNFNLVGGETTVDVYAIDQDIGNPDDFIGKSSYPLSQFTSTSQGRQWFPMKNYFGGDAGQVLLDWTYSGGQAIETVTSLAPQITTRTGDDLPDYHNPDGYAQAGTLHVRPMQAQLSHNLDHYSKQDPYVIVEVGDKVNQTQVHSLGGKAPVWNDNLTFQLDGSEKDVILKVFDYDQYSEHDYIGGRMLPANKMFDTQSGQKWVHMLRNGVDGGWVLFDWNYGPQPLPKPVTAVIPGQGYANQVVTTSHNHRVGSGYVGTVNPVVTTSHRVGGFSKTVNPVVTTSHNQSTGYMRPGQQIVTTSHNRTPQYVSADDNGRAQRIVGEGQTVVTTGTVLRKSGHTSPQYVSADDVGRAQSTPTTYTTSNVIRKSGYTTATTPQYVSADNVGRTQRVLGGSHTTVSTGNVLRKSSYNTTSTPQYVSADSVGRAQRVMGGAHTTVTTGNVLRKSGYNTASSPQYVSADNVGRTQRVMGGGHTTVTTGNVLRKSGYNTASSPQYVSADSVGRAQRVVGGSPTSYTTGNVLRKSGYSTNVGVTNALRKSGYNTASSHQQYFSANTGGSSSTRVIRNGTVYE